MKTNLIIRICATLSVAGPTNAKNSEGGIQDGTASTPRVTPASSLSVKTSEVDFGGFSSVGLSPDSRKI